MDSLGGGDRIDNQGWMKRGPGTGGLKQGGKGKRVGQGREYREGQIKLSYLRCNMKM